jgi:hypothetical protein
MYSSMMLRVVNQEVLKQCHTLSQYHPVMGLPGKMYGSSKGKWQGYPATKCGESDVIG